MSTLIGAMGDAMNEYEELADPDDYIAAAAELSGTVGEFLNASKREQLAEILRDENGLAPTDAALDVIMAVIESTNKTDALWGESEQPNSPTAWHYAMNAGIAIDHVKRTILR